MIGQQLNGQREDHRCDQFVDGRQRDRRHCVELGSGSSLLIRDEDDTAAARGDFLHVRNGLFEETIVRCNHDDGHVLVDQRDRAVLQLAGSITFGVNIGNFLELQRAFQRQREAGAPAEIKHVLEARQIARQALYLRLDDVEHLAHDARHLDQMLHKFLFLTRLQRAARLAGGNGERSKHRKLAGEGLGGSDADFRSGKDREDGVRFPGNGRFPHIDDGADLEIAFLAIAQRCQRIGCLTRLRDEERRLRWLKWHFTIAELGGHIDLHRQARITLEPVFADQAGKISRAAGGDRKSGKLGEIDGLIGLFHGLGGEIHIMAERMGNDFRLLVDFLFHEVAMVALVDHIGRRLRYLPLALHRLAGEIDDLSTLPGHDGAVAIHQIGDLVGEGRQRNGVGTQEHFSAAITDGKRRAGARRKQRTGIVLEHHHQRIGACDTIQHLQHSLTMTKTLAGIFRQKLRHHFGVGLGGEGRALGGQFFAQFGEVFDDAVMDDGHAIDEVRVSVGFVRHAVGRPACMRDADHARKRLFGHQLFQIEELALGTAAIHRAIVDRCNAG